MNCTCTKPFGRVPGFHRCPACLSKLWNAMPERCLDCEELKDLLDGRCIHCWRDAAIHNRNLVLSIP